MTRVPIWTQRQAAPRRAAGAMQSSSPGSSFLLRWQPLDNRILIRRWNHPGQFPSCRCQQLAELGSVRSRPQGRSAFADPETSRKRSSSPGPITQSTTSSFPPGFTPWRQAFRILMQASSGQSWMMCFIMYASARGTIPNNPCVAIATAHDAGTTNKKTTPTVAAAHRNLVPLLYTMRARARPRADA